VKELSVFGSAARGEMCPESDIDFLAEFLPESETDLFKHFATKRELSTLMGRKVDMVSKRVLREALRKEVLALSGHQSVPEVRFILISHKNQWAFTWLG